MNTISELNSLYNKLNLKLDNNKDILSKGLYQDVKSLFLWINDNDEDNQENNYIIRHKILFLGNIEILILNEDDKILQNKYFEFIEKMAEISGYNKNLYIKLEFNNSSPILRFFKPSSPITPPQIVLSISKIINFFAGNIEKPIIFDILNARSNADSLVIIFPKECQSLGEYHSIFLESILCCSSIIE